jgi:predicted DNA-binding transcriptional regulator YafY
VAWCELRGDFRHFRTDRMQRAEVARERYPGTRARLLAQWRA